jgi:5-methylcytosine-specific restriction enzyme subunit McrC
MSDLTPLGGTGPPITDEAAVGTEPPTAPLSLGEHEEKGPFPVSDADAEFLDTMERQLGTEPFTATFQRDGQVVISSGSHVGVLTLPSGLRIEVTPKTTVTRLLWALQYAFDTPVETFDEETEFTSATSFFDAIGTLFHAELQSVFADGLHRDYVSTSSIETQVKGRINVQQQLQRPSPVTTDFAVTYDEHTTDNLLNQAVLAALQSLLVLVSDDTLAARLRTQSQRLEQYATPTPITPAAIRSIELSRLNDHYAALLELATLVLEREFFEDVRAGTQRSLALFVNMNHVFERIVERAFRDATRNTPNRVDDQASIPNLIDGPHAVSMRPDILIRTADGDPLMVADAKWKTHSESPSAADIYQLTSYILTLNIPGVLIYPGSNSTTATSTVGNHHLHSFELPTDATATTYDDYTQQLQAAATRCLHTNSNS